jgi:hypothetical protein
MTRPNKRYEDWTPEERAQHEDEWRRNHRTSEEIAMSRMFSSGQPQTLPFDTVGDRGQVIQEGVSGDERARRLRDIDRTMLDVIADTRRTDPKTGGVSSPLVQVVGAVPTRSGPRGNGWARERPLHSSETDRTNALIDAMVHQAQPHAAEHPDYKRWKKEGS